MSSSLDGLLSERELIAQAFLSFETDAVRLVDTDLSEATHLVATRRGLYGVSNRGWTLAASGFFFGITLRGDDIYVFEACDQPRSPLRRGRVIRLTRERQQITRATVVAKGLDCGCHQIDFIGDRLHVLDTYNQVVLRFDPGMTTYETLTPLPTTEGRWDKYDLRYGHVNTILHVGDRVLLLLHNCSEYTGRTSEVAVFSRDWKPLERWKVNGRSCHGMAILEDGTLLICDTMSGDLISADGDVRVHVSPYITRGLSVGEDSIVVGGSKRAEREDRLLSEGTVTFLDRNYEVKSVLNLPGAPTEIRRLDGKDGGLSSYLRTVPWGANLKEGTLAGTETSATPQPMAPRAPSARKFVQVGTTATVFAGEAEEAKAQFRQYRALHLADILAPDLLATVLRVCEFTSFGPGEKDAPGLREVELSPQRAGRILNLALNRPVFLRWLEQITGCGPLRSIAGRLTQTRNAPGHELRWHDDYLESEGRRLAIVINLSTESYEGGEFAIRPKGGEVIFEHKHTESGSALVFDVDRKLEHRVRPVSAGGPRRVFAGWAFRNGAA